MTDTKKDGAKRPCVYMLRCKDGSLYTGWTNDFEKRLAAHQNGKGAKYTRSHLPVEPAYLEYLPDKIAAVIMGCTELSVIYRDLKLRETCEDVIDSLWVLARSTVLKSGKQLRD